MITETDPAAEAATPITVEIVPAELGLAPDAKSSLELAFTGFFAQARQWEAQAALITEPKLARAARLELKAVRVAAEKKRKELKEDSLRMGRAIDGANNILVALIAPIEKKLEDIEKAEERAEADRLAKLAAERKAELDSLEHDCHGLNLSILTDDQWQSYLQSAKDARQARLDREARERAEAEAKAAREREEAEKRAKAEAEEREKLRAEQERLRKEAEAAKAKAEEERKAREAAEAKAKAERDAVEAKARQEREAAEAKAKAAEAEAKRLREAEERRIREEKEAAAAKAKAEAAAARKAARAPDKDKLIALAGIIRALEVPAMKTEEGETLAGQIEVRARKFAQWITEEAEKL